MVVTMQEKVSMTFWWVVAAGVTTYLMLGIVNTIIVVLH